MSHLTEFQIDVARLFFALPEVDGYLLAGGGALIAHGLIDRQTRDLDFFGSLESTQVNEVVEAFASAAREFGWECEIIQTNEQFARLRVSSTESLIVDIGIDSPGRHGCVETAVGPTLNHLELAARKLGALFDRAEARDFADVFVLCQRFERETLLELAQEMDSGMSRKELAHMLRTLGRFVDSDIPLNLERIPELRVFFESWAGELDS